MAKRKQIRCGYRTRRHGPYIMTRWWDDSRLLILKLPYCSSDDEMRLEFFGMPDVLGTIEELNHLQCAVQHLPMADYLDKLFQLHRHDVVYMGMCD